MRAGATLPARSVCAERGEMSQTTIESSAPAVPRKIPLVLRHEPALRSSIWQIANSLLPYLALWALMIWSLDVSYWITLALAPVAAGFLTRIFIIFHDCAHGSFFESRRANRLVEFVTGVLTFTPFRQWRHQHNLHHATSGDLDRRGTGDIWVLTVEEYLAAPRWKRILYRVSRSPLVLFVILPLYLFLIHHRFPSWSVAKHARRGVWWTNAALLAIVLAMSLTIGIKSYLLIQLPIMVFAGIAGVWLFYVQHQFEGVYWQRRPEWDFVDAAIRGSSFYKLPKVLQWFTGNIGFHHVHHLSPSIPNYRLERCHEENPIFQKATIVTLMSGLRSLRVHLWDEQRRRLVGWGGLKGLRRTAS